MQSILSEIYRGGYVAFSETSGTALKKEFKMGIYLSELHTRKTDMDIPGELWYSV